MKPLHSSTTGAVRRGAPLGLIAFLVLGIIVIEIELTRRMTPVLSDKQQSAIKQHVLVKHNCTFAWKDFSCSEGCCIQTQASKEVGLSVCEPCHKGSLEMMVGGNVRSALAKVWRSTNTATATPEESLLLDKQSIDPTVTADQTVVSKSSNSTATGKWHKVWNSEFTVLRNKSVQAWWNRDENSSALRPRILCWMIAPRVSREMFLVHITWGRRCNKLVFFVYSTSALPGQQSTASSAKPVPQIYHTLVSNADVYKLSFSPSVSKSDEQHHVKRVILAWKFLYDQYKHQYDWFLRSELDTYIVMDNLRHYLTHEPYIKANWTDTPFYLGRVFKSVSDSNSDVKTEQAAGLGDVSDNARRSDVETDTGAHLEAIRSVRQQSPSGNADPVVKPIDSSEQHDDLSGESAESNSLLGNGLTKNMRLGGTGSGTNVKSHSNSKSKEMEPAIERNKRLLYNAGRAGYLLNNKALGLLLCAYTSTEQYCKAKLSGDSGDISAAGIAVDSNQTVTTPVNDTTSSFNVDSPIKADAQERISAPHSKPHSHHRLRHKFRNRYLGKMQGIVKSISTTGVSVVYNSTLPVHSSAKVCPGVSLYPMLSHDDQIVGCLLRLVNVLPHNTQDKLGRERFNNYNYGGLVFKYSRNPPGYSSFYRKSSLNTKPYPECCSPRPLSFHKSNLEALEHVLYNPMLNLTISEDLLMLT